MNNIKNPSPNVMNTWTGRQFDPLHMQPSDVSLEDIAHALSLLCRGGGQLCRRGPRPGLVRSPCPGLSAP